MSGFRAGGAIFEEFKVDQVWLAWTENPEDELAQARSRSAAMTADRAMAAAWRAAGRRRRGRGDGDGSRAPRVQRRGARSRPKTAAQGAGLRRTGPGASAEFLRPATMPRSALAARRAHLRARPAVRPATLDQAHGRARPTRSSTRWRPSRRLAPMRLLLRPSRRSRTARRPRPTSVEQGCFDPRFRVRLRGGVGGRFERSTSATRQAWRSIDHDWLGVAAELALQLDRETNNTSLALAFELVPTAACCSSRRRAGRQLALLGRRH